jgi:hypothetical protein
LREKKRGEGEREEKFTGADAHEDSFHRQRTPRCF